MANNGNSLNNNHCSTQMELLIRFAVWMLARDTEPTHLDVMDRWHVSRATAYRWLAAWRDAIASSD